MQQRRTALGALLLLLQLALVAQHVAGSGATPAGRTAIKINADVPKPAGGNTPPPPRGTTGGRGVPPVLFRQPNPVVPPPFLQVDVALSAMDGAGAAAAAAGGDDTVFASYYGEPDSEHPPGEGFVAGSVPGGADSAAASGAVMLDEFGYPLRDATSFVEGGPAEQLAAWTELSGQCWTFASASYVYSFCPYQNVTQKSTSTTLHVVMGVWDAWVETDNNNPDSGATTTTATAAAGDAAATPASSTANAATGFLPGSLLQSFTDGTACGNGKRRSTKVLFLCDALAEDGGRISDVNEPATCEYTIKFHTALVCDRATIAAAKTGQAASGTASASASSSSSAAADHTVLQSMQSCITLLFHSAYPADGDAASVPRHQDVLARCRNFLPLDARNEAFDDEESTSASPAAAAAAAVTPPVAAARSVELSSLVSDDAAAAATTRANIPASIIADADAALASSHSNAVEADEELNGDFSLEASSSPYAELDDRDQQ